MRLTFAPMTERDVRTVAGWTYEPPYDIYNLDAAPLDDLLAALLDPRNAYYAITDEAGDLIGFCCYGPDARIPGGDYTAPAVDVGIGLRPDLTGRGLGPAVIGAVLDFADAIMHPTMFRTTIAAFNQRSIRAFERVGFQEVGRFTGDTEPREWVQLTLPQPR
ncbi:MAG: GNAT family N-acetyltransferase [Chloroflexota bacterium]|nr:GNAT family N-acetyltransferase [Chloroflexota bacterium]